MSLLPRLKAKLQRESRDPHVAGLAYAAVAFTFTFLYFAGFSQNIALSLVFALAISGNAYAWSRAIWRRRIPQTGSITRRTSATTGAIIGLTSYITVGAVYLVVFLFFNTLDPSSTLDLLPTVPGSGPLYTLAYFVMWSLIFSFYGVVFTLGIPIVLSIGTALGLNRAERNSESTTHQS